MDHEEFAEMLFNAKKLSSKKEREKKKQEHDAMKPEDALGRVWTHFLKDIKLRCPCLMNEVESFKPILKRHLENALDEYDQQTYQNTM